MHHGMEDVWKAQRGRERPCDTTVTFRCGAVTHDTLRTHLLSSGYVFMSAAAQATHLQPCQFMARFHSRQKSRKRVGDNSEAPGVDVGAAEISLQGSGDVSLVGEPVIAASAATEAARTSGRAISSNTEATSGYPAPPFQRLPHPP
jgi:hypothetical protein